MERQSVRKAQRSDPGKDHSPARRSANLRNHSHPILALQHTIGNQAVHRFLQSSHIQPKLKVNESGDKYEQEADRTADAVMRTPSDEGAAPAALSISRTSGGQAQRAEKEDEPEVQRSPLSQKQEPVEEFKKSGGPLLQRQGVENEHVQREEAPEEEKALQRQEDQTEKPEPEPVARQEAVPDEEPVSRKEEKQEEEVQRQEAPEENKEAEKVQRQEAPEEMKAPENNEDQGSQLAQRQEGEKGDEMAQRAEEENDEKPVMTARTQGKAPAVPSGFSSSLRESSGEGRPIPEETRGFFESRFGADFSSVRIHTGTKATRLNKSIQAKAFTRADHIYFSDGAYDPSSSAGKTLLAHELTHVVQQNHAQPSVGAQSPAAHGAQASGVLQRQESNEQAEDLPTEEQKAAALASAARAEKMAQQAANYGKEEIAKSKQQKAEEKQDEQAAKQVAHTAGGQAKEAEAKSKKRKKPGEAMKPGVAVEEPEQEGAAAESEKKAPSSPDEDPAFQNVVKKVGGVAKKQKAHALPQTKAAEAQAAAEAPAQEISGRAENTHAGQMEKTETPPFNAEAFKKQLLKRIEELAPKSQEEADDFKEDNKLGGVKEQMSSGVAEGKAESRGPLEAKKDEAPDTKSVEPKPVTPIPDPAAGTAPPGVGANEAAPKPKTAAEVEAPIQENTNRVGDEMSKESITEEQLAKSNEPQFQQALSSKQEAETHAAESPQDYRKSEQAQLNQAQKQASATAAAQTMSMHVGREQAFGQVHEAQGRTKSKDEAARLEVGEHIHGIYEKTKTEVERILSELDGKVETAFDEGAEAAKTAFENYVDAQMDAYKDRRYGGWLGWGRWLKDKLAGMPDEVNAFYETGRNLYLRKMDAVLDNVVAIIGAELTAAKAEIAKGRKEISEYLAGLPTNLQTVGAEAAEEANTLFDSLEENVNDKQGALIDRLANKYQENLKAVDARIEELKAANRGLVDKAIDAIKSVINTIIELKNMLFRVLAKIAEVVMMIISDPIGFLKNMIAAIKQGLDMFIGAIETHIKVGFVTWLTGAMGSTRIQMPEDVFSLKGIFSLIVQVLGLSWDYIRSKAVKLLGEPVVKALETGFELFQILIKEGPAGLWEYAKEKFSDLKEMIIEQIKSMLITEVIKAGIKWLLGLLNPVAAFIKAAIAIYDIVSFFVQRAKQIMELIEAFVDGVAAVAKGSIAGAAKLIEAAFVKALPLVIGLLAKLLGISGLADKVQKLFKSLQKRVDKFIDGVILKAKQFASKVLKKLPFGGKDARTDKEKVNDLDRATADAEQVLSKNDATPQSINKELPKIKKRYRLTEISLVSIGPGKYHIDLLINPGKRTRDKEVDEEKEDDDKSRPVFSEATKKEALQKLTLIKSPEDVNPAMVEVATKPGNEGILERYKNGPGDSYVLYLSKQKKGKPFDWPLAYLRRRASFKRGKITERDWAGEVFPGASAMPFLVKFGRRKETFIPDIVSSTVIGDVKNVKRQALVPQLVAFEMIAHPSKYPGKVFENDGTTPVKNNRKFELIVRGKKHSEGQTDVTEPLLNALDKKPHYIIHDQPEEEK